MARIKEDYSEYLTKNIVHYKKFSTQELEDLYELIKTDSRGFDTELIQVEIEKRLSIRDRVLRQKFEKKSSWGFPFPVLKYKIETNITEEQHWFLINQIMIVMFWGLDVSWRSIFNKNLYRNRIGLERKLISDYEKSQNPRFDPGNPKVITKLDKMGNILIRCVNTSTLIYDPEENNITLQQFLFALTEVSKKEKIQL